MQEISKYSEKPPIKLDLKDRKILFELDFNARVPYSRLAKRIRMSKQGVEYRVKNLMKKGVIRGFYPVINVPKLGYIYCRLLLTLQNITKEKKDEIIEYLKNHKKVFWLFSMQGMFDLLIVIWAKSITEFKEFVEEVETKFGENIKRKVETITTDVVHYQHRYLLGKKETKEIHIRETAERIRIDELDKKILSLLCTDARIPLVDISRKVNESAKVVAYRIKKLEKKGLIEGYRPIIDHNKIGFTYYKVLINLYNISKKTLIRLKSYIRNNPAVIYIVEGIGLPADLEIEMMVESNKQLFDFINDLRFRFPKIVGEYNTVIFMDTLKVKYLPS
jgi:DNA-binding Lrp family transcriptional regulator